MCGCTKKISGVKKRKTKRGKTHKGYMPISSISPLGAISAFFGVLGVGYLLNQ